MRKQLFLFAMLPILWSCAEEVSKDINTDLTQEAEQFYSFSEAISEGAFLANITYAEYARMTPAQLSGCPSITHSLDSRIVTLDYSSSGDCAQENANERTGKIILDFTQSGEASPAWSLSYEDYSYNGNKIEGKREFRGLSVAENQEKFEQLRFEMANQVTFMVNGEFSYTVSRSNLKLSALSARGKASGTNPAGRDFSLVTSVAKNQLFPCYGQGWNLPVSGKESWIVSRGGSSDLEYQVTFNNTDTCNPNVTALLPDGRSLQLNP